MSGIHSSNMSIQSVSLEDLPRLLFIAVNTGDTGQDATGLNANDDMVGEVYVAPYVILSPEVSFGLYHESQLVGYAVGTVDTALFESKAAKSWWPELQMKYEDLANTSSEDWLVQEIFSPSSSPPEILGDFPSHGHINILPNYQGAGWGKKLMQTLEEGCAERGSSGIHLRVSKFNDSALRFYSTIGYQEIYRRDNEVIVGKSLSSK